MARSIRDSLSKLDTSLDEIKTALQEAYVNVGDNIKLSEVAGYIDTIPIEESLMYLKSGKDFNKIIKAMSGWDNVTSIIFTKNNPPSTFTDVSYKGDGSVVAWINGDTLYVSAFGKRITAYDFGNMFDGCGNITNIDLRLLDTYAVTAIDYMFNNCTNLISIDVDHFDITRVTMAAYTFAYCKNLNYIYCNQNWYQYYSNWRDKGRLMFAECAVLSDGQLNKFTPRYAQPIEDGGFFTKTV